MPVYQDFDTAKRRDDGVLLVAGHTLGGPVQLSVQNHRSLGQMFGHVAKRRAVHGKQHIASTVDYVREGRKHNFDS